MFERKFSLISETGECISNNCASKTKKTSQKYGRVEGGSAWSWWEKHEQVLLVPETRELVLQQQDEHEEAGRQHLTARPVAERVQNLDSSTSCGTAEEVSSGVHIHFGAHASFFLRVQKDAPNPGVSQVHSKGQSGRLGRRQIPESYHSVDQAESPPTMRGEVSTSPG